MGLVAVCTLNIIHKTKFLRFYEVNKQCYIRQKSIQIFHSPGLFRLACLLVNQESQAKKFIGCEQKYCLPDQKLLLQHGGSVDARLPLHYLPPGIGIHNHLY